MRTHSCKAFSLSIHTNNFFPTYMTKGTVNSSNIQRFFAMHTNPVAQNNARKKRSLAFMLGVFPSTVSVVTWSSFVNFGRSFVFSPFLHKIYAKMPQQKKTIHFPNYQHQKFIDSFLHSFIFRFRILIFHNSCCSKWQISQQLTAISMKLVLVTWEWKKMCIYVMNMTSFLKIETKKLVVFIKWA